MKIIILGAGVIGVTTAYYLNKLGFDVTIIERNSASAAECSFANGGQLSYSHAEPWASPAALKKIPKWLFAKDSPLVFHPKLDPFMWQWSMKFLANCSEEQKLTSTKNTLRLALYSRDCFAEIIKDTGLEFSYINKGTIHSFRDEKSMNANIAQAEFQKNFGCDYSILPNREACEAIEPALKYAPAKIIGGIYFPMDATGDINQFTTNLAQILSKKGVRFLYNESVEQIHTNNGKITTITTTKGNYTADNFVVALGANSRIILKKIGINLPIYPMKGYSLSISIENMEKTPLMGVTDQHNKIVYSRLGNILRVAGTAEFDGFSDKISPARIATLKRMIDQLFPFSGNVNTAKGWACLRPSTPKGTPILGETSYDNLYLNTGHGTLGWTLSAGSANIIASLINKKPAEIDLSGLKLGEC